MPKIDLSGNSGWQSKAGDKIKSLQNGNYDYVEITVDPQDVDISWVEQGLIVQVLEGELQLKSDDGFLSYEKDEIIYLNDENIKDFQLVISNEIKLGIFKEKPKK